MTSPLCRRKFSRANKLLRTASLPVAGDRHSTQGHNDSAARWTPQLLNKPFEPSPCIHSSTGSRDLIEVFGNDAARFDQLTHRIGGFIGSHREQIAAMNDGEIDDDSRITGPETTTL